MLLHPLRRLPELLAILLPLGYVLFFLAPARELPPGSAFLGLVHPDQVVYYALAREAVETGPLYASPFSARGDSPRIYSHFAFIAIGWFWYLSGFSLPVLDYLLRFGLGALAMLLLVGIFRAALPRRAPASLAGAIVLSCGGIAWLIATIHFIMNTAAGAGRPSLEGWLNDFRWVENSYGEWYLNMFGNLAFTHELFFHVLFFACVLALLRGRGWLAAGLLGLAWWSHPYTGLQLGMIAGIFLLVEARWGIRRPGPLAAVWLLNLGWIAYYLLFLPRFEEHAVVFAVMRRFSTPMLAHKLLPAYGLFLVLPVLWVAGGGARRHLSRPTVRLMAVWLLVTVALVFHDRLLFFVKPFQPMHFTRGYLFIPLVFFSVLALTDWAGRRGWPRRRLLLVLAGLLLLQLPDNLIRTAELRREARLMPGRYFIDRERLELLGRLGEVEPPLTILDMLPVGEVRHLIPTLTPHRAIAAHIFNTPHYIDFFMAATRLRDEPNDERLRALGAEALLIRKPELERLRAALAGHHLKIVLEHGEILLVTTEPR